MPLYEFKCEMCGHRFDKLVRRHDDPVTCPVCRGKVQKLMSTFAVGSGDKMAGRLQDTTAGGKSWLGCSKC